MRKFRTVAAVAALAAMALLVPATAQAGASAHDAVVVRRSAALASAGAADYLTDDD